MLLSSPLPLLIGVACFHFGIGSQDALAQTPLLTLQPDSTSRWFGWSVDFAGDVDGDGFDDLVIGAADSSPTTGGRGSVEVFSGATGARLYYLPGRHQGYSVAGAGDVNGDGFDDFICGAHNNDEIVSGGGAAFVYSGVDGQILYTWYGSVGQRMGAKVAGGGDVNGDGFADPIVSYGGLSINNRGGTRVFSGATGAILHTFTGFTGNTFSGSAIDNAGDINADGFDDVIMGGFFSSRAKVFSGFDGSVLYAMNGSLHYGDSVGGLGDINGDGFGDFIVGSPDSLSYGEAFVYSGADGQILYSFEGELGLMNFGYAVAGPGDVDGDGIPDIAVSAPWTGPLGKEKGYVRVYSGATGSTIYTMHGTSSLRLFGRSIAGGGDINGDGYADIVAGAHLDQSLGKAYLFGPSFTGDTTVCIGRANSTDVGARIIAHSPSNFVASLNDTVLGVTNLPTQTPTLAMMLNSPSFGLAYSTAPAGYLSEGTLCIAGGQIGRFNLPGQLYYDTTGVFRLPLDLMNIPWTDPSTAPLYSTVLQAGETWFFQCWYRDVPSSSGPVFSGNSTYSDAIQITFQ